MKHIIMNELKSFIKSKIFIAMFIFTIVYILLMLSFDLKLFKSITPYLIGYEGTWSENISRYDDFQSLYKEESQSNHYLLNPDADDIPAQANLLLNESLNKLNIRENWLDSIYSSGEYNQEFIQRIMDLPPTQYRIVYMWINANDYLTGGVGFLTILILVFLLASQYSRDTGIKELQIASKAGLDVINSAKFYSSIIIGVAVGMFFVLLTIFTRLLAIGFYNSTAPLNSMFVYTSFNITVGTYMLVTCLAFVLGCGYISAIIHKVAQRVTSPFICSLICICVAILPGLSLTTEIYGTLNVPNKVIDVFRVLSPMTIMAADFFKQSSSIHFGFLEIPLIVGSLSVFGITTICLFLTKRGRLKR